eukprot:scaffold157956_cov16-Prasinocladus_malaysianus.AAC.2
MSLRHAHHELISVRFARYQGSAPPRICLDRKNIFLRFYMYALMSGGDAAKQAESKESPPTDVSLWALPLGGGVDRDSCRRRHGSR